jgi:hypothetical protein
VRFCLSAWGFCIQSGARGPGITIYRFAQRGGVVGRDDLFYSGRGAHFFQPRGKSAVNSSSRGCRGADHGGALHGSPTMVRWHCPGSSNGRMALFRTAQFKSFPLDFAGLSRGRAGGRQASGPANEGFASEKVCDADQRGTESRGRAVILDFARNVAGHKPVGAGRSFVLLLAPLKWKPGREIERRRALSLSFKQPITSDCASSSRRNQGLTKPPF